MHGNFACKHVNLLGWLAKGIQITCFGIDNLKAPSVS
jgi:hypothetical protein